MTSTLAGILVVAATATLGDFIWYTVGVRHTMTAGLIHGALLLTSVGAVLGASSGHLVKGLPIGMLAGIGGALCYYLLIVVMDSRTYGTAIPGAWVFMWLLLAALDGRWLRAPNRRRWSDIVRRGVLAAIIGGLAFALVRNVLWGRPPGASRNYLLQFVTWAFAWAPGLVALTWGRSTSEAQQATEMPVGRTSASSSSQSTQGTATAGAHDGSPEGGAGISAIELIARLDGGETLHILDVRSEGEFSSGHVPGAVNVPFTQVSGRIQDVPGSAAEELIVYCGHGPRAYMAAAALRSAGRQRIVYLTGHFSGWQSAGHRVQR